MKAAYKITLIFLLISTFGFSQDTANHFTVKNVWRIPFLLPGISYENQVSQNSTFVAAFTFSGYYGRGGNYGYTNTPTTLVVQKLDYYSLNTSLSAGYRFYYNFKKRQRQSKSIKANSANYISIKSSYTFPSLLRQEPYLYIYQLDQDQIIQFPIQNKALYQALDRINEGPSINILWGFQRTYKRNFYLNFALGIGLLNHYLGPVSDFTIGYTFLSR
ncbi:hypothetical protein [Spirosoma litoris]